MPAGRPVRTLSLVEWLDGGFFVQRAWTVNEAMVRKLRALLGPPVIEQLHPPGSLGAMQAAAIESGSVMLEIPVDDMDSDSG